MFAVRQEQHQYQQQYKHLEARISKLNKKISELNMITKPTAKIKNELAMLLLQFSISGSLFF